MPFYNRRKFIKDAGIIAGASIAVNMPATGFAAESKKPTASFTVKDVIDIIKKEVPDFNRPATVDQLRSGSMEQVVTGIVTTMFPTIGVIEKNSKGRRQFYHCP